MQSKNEGERFMNCNNLRSQHSNMASTTVVIKNRSHKPLHIISAMPYWGDLRPTIPSGSVILPGEALTTMLSNKDWCFTGATMEIVARFEDAATGPVLHMHVDIPIIGWTKTKLTMARTDSDWGVSNLMDHPISSSGPYLTLSGYVDNLDVIFAVETMVEALYIDKHEESALPRQPCQKPFKERNYYERLEVSPTASLDEIKRSFKAMALKHHPDKNAGDPEADLRFKCINEAYICLQDPVKREAYDSAGRSVPTGATNMSMSNLISMLFGGEAFKDLFGKTTHELEVTPGYIDCLKSILYQEIRKDHKRLSRVLHERVLLHLGNQPLFEHVFRKECQTKRSAPGGVGLLEACGKAYCRALSLEGEGCMRVGAWCTNIEMDHERVCCSMLPATMKYGAATHAKNKAHAEVSNAQSRGEIDAVEAEGKQKEINEIYFKATLSALYAFGLNEIHDQVMDIAKQTLYGFFAKCPKDVAERAVLAVHRMGTIMKEVARGGDDGDHVETIMKLRD
eukprot:PhF_6_TR8645/c0_g1_i1/m.13506